MDEETYLIEDRVSRQSWWFRGRRRILNQILGELLPPLPPRARMLDVGCGTGANEVVLQSEGRFVVGVDASPLPLRLLECRRSGEGTSMCAEAQHLPIGDDTFDLVVALDVLEHIDDDQRAASEIARVCKPDGRVVIFVPALMMLWGAQDEVAWHRRRYSRTQLLELVQSAGLEVQRLTFFNSLMVLPIFLYRLAWRITPSREAFNENELVGPRVNALLDRLFALEVPLLRRIDLPIGVSLAIVATPRD